MKIDNPEKIYKDDDIHINQDKPLDAERTIREQQKLLAQKNAQLKQEKDKRIQLEKLLCQRTEELTEANRKLIRTVKELTQRNLEIQEIQQVIEFLQYCESEEETYHVLIGACRRLFPSDTGYISLLDEVAKSLKVVDFWGDFDYEGLEFDQRQCWAIRRGTSHAVEHPQLDPVCPHLDMSRDKRCLCVPMIAHGKVLGMMHLLIRSENPQPGRENMHAFASKRRLFVNIANRYAMCLVDLRLLKDLKTLSIRDQLTGLYNRRHMEASFQREMDRAQRHGTSLGAIMIDVDYFNVFNDTYGHEIGDMVLQELGSFFLRRTRNEDIACRYGGEEILIIMPGASKNDAQKRAEELRQGVEQLTVTVDDDEAPTVTVSLGVAVFPEHGATVEAVLKSADSALYRAKNKGRNRVVMA